MDEINYSEFSALFEEWCEYENELKQEHNNPDIRIDWFGIEVGEA